MFFIFSYVLVHLLYRTTIPFQNLNSSLIGFWALYMMSYRLTANSYYYHKFSNSHTVCFQYYDDSHVIKCMSIVHVFFVFHFPTKSLLNATSYIMGVHIL